METTPAPTLESELPTGLYSEEEKGLILRQIEEAAGSGHLSADTEVFAPKKSGVLFPILVNLAAVAIIVGAWFVADNYYQTKQQGLKLRTDKLFSTESKLVAKVLADSKAKMEAANAEITKIQGDLQQAAADKANLQKTFEDRVAAQDKSLRKELADALDAEKKRLQAAGLSVNEVSRRLVEFENTKNVEFNNKLDTYKKEAQAEIDKRAIALTTLQAKLQTTVNEQDKLRQDIESQTKEREGALQTQLSSQSADLDALKRERDEVNSFFRQTDSALAGVKAAFESKDWGKTQTAVDTLRQVLSRGANSPLEAVRSRAQAQTVLADTFDGAVQALDGAVLKSDTTQIDALKAQAKKDLAAAAAQLAEAQQVLANTDAKWRQAEDENLELKSALQELSPKVSELQAERDGNAAQADEARTSAAALNARVAELEQAVVELTPYKQRIETLTSLFTASYPSAQERFTATLGSAEGALVFPQFDEAWTVLTNQFREANQAQAVRKQALDDVLAFTTYLRGLSKTPIETRDASTKLARTDDDYKKVVEGIQSLAVNGTAETNVNTAKTQLYGTVAVASSVKIVLEPLTKVRPEVGQLIELRRVVGKKETVLGRGTVLTATAARVEIDWSSSSLPLSGDAAYLVLP